MFLENLTKLEKNLWKSHVEFVGVDHDMAEMYAEDRNDVIEVKERSKMTSLMKYLLVSVELNVLVNYSKVLKKMVA